MYFITQVLNLYKMLYFSSTPKKNEACYVSLGFFQFELPILTQAITSVTKNVAPGSGGPKFSMAEVGKHTTAESCWVVVGGKVYDVTKWLSSHPGGADILLGVAGEHSH